MIIHTKTTKKQISELRRRANLSDKEIAEMAGLARQTVWRLRTGKHKSTSAEAKIADLHATFLKPKNSS